MEVLGDLSDGEARRFTAGVWEEQIDGQGNQFTGLSSQSEGTPELGEQDWQNVWSVCEGNILLLAACVREARATGSWETGEQLFPLHFFKIFLFRVFFYHFFFFFFIAFIAAVSSILTEPSRDVRAALFEPEMLLTPDGASPRVWTAEHYRIALRLIINSKYHAIEKRD